MTEFSFEESSKKYSPHLNDKMISIYILPDGSWMGEAQRFNRLVVVREAKPEDCLQRILTHE